MEQFYASAEAEAVALRRAAARAGCRVRTVVREAAHMGIVGGRARVIRGGETSTVGEVSCRDGWAAGRLLLALAVEDSLTPGARKLAAQLREVAPDDEAFARAVHALVRRVPFVQEAGEIFQSGAVTLGANQGDCDDHFRLAYALGVAGGLRGALGILHHGKHAPPDKRGPAHAVVMWFLNGWTYAESTVAAEFGENPNGAARRLGLTNERSDIAKEVRIMTEQDLRPVPAGFRARNSAAQVSLDAQALQKLGYLSEDAPAEAMIDPTFTVLRRAVLAFQVATGLVPDGLLGPTTRLTLAREVDKRPEVREVFPYAGLSGLGDPDRHAESADLSDGFLADVIAMSDRFAARGARAVPEDWCAVWLAESGIRNIPNAAGQPYYGLNQMGVAERQACGFHGSTEEWLALPLRAQLVYVERFYESAERMGGGARVFADAGALYVANIAPGKVGHAGDPSFPLYTAQANPQQYQANRQLDRQRKGFISVDDMRAAVESAAAVSPRFAEVRARLRAMGAEPSRSIGGGPGLRGVASLLVVLATIGASVWQVRA